MDDLLSKRIDDVRGEIVNVEKRQDVKWVDHIKLHVREADHKLESKHFIIGVVFLSVLDIGVAVLLHFIS